MSAPAGPHRRFPRPGPAQRTRERPPQNGPLQPMALVADAVTVGRRLRRRPHYVRCRIGPTALRASTIPPKIVAAMPSPATRLVAVVVIERVHRRTAQRLAPSRFQPERAAAAKQGRDRASWRQPSCSAGVQTRCGQSSLCGLLHPQTFVSFAARHALKSARGNSAAQPRVATVTRPPRWQSIPRRERRNYHSRRVPLRGR